ncbi:hypothetical protein M427DRAFT_453366 [Gonapodya prolifera JEL478]|uniref:Uncharacterized protein n=1 Tax=Gonapodya prolifera (strain JEL478) TaxID=1344416 RepID=A0A139ASE0_GONPJ|nr:hypothetical protein M427DRAFT_453366 [Gonapodya prolifera JEL478]|eukprot:KXS19564.1 hypothetical protein M427DRAFT_453366 [Gonapodya prolifera JEL478]
MRALCFRVGHSGDNQWLKPRKTAFMVTKEGAARCLGCNTTKKDQKFLIMGSLQAVLSLANTFAVDWGLAMALIRLLPPSRDLFA